MNNGIRVLIMASSRGGGLSYNISKLAMKLSRHVSWVGLIADVGDQVDGLSDILTQAALPVQRIPDLDSLQPADVLWSLHSFRTLLRKLDVDIIHANGVFHACLARLAAPHIPIVTTEHTSAHFSNSFRARLAKLALVGCSTTIIAVSEYSRNQLMKGGVPGSRIVTVPNSIDIEWFNSQLVHTCQEEKERKYIVCVGSLVDWKGQKHALEAFALIADHLPDTDLVLVGDGPDRHLLEGLAQSLGVSNRVRFLGHLPPSRVADMLANAWIAVIPSLRENFPFVMLEAMAAGLPIVATRVGGIPEAIRNIETGMLVPPAAPRSMADAILELYDNPLEKTRLGQEARALVEERFSLELQAQQLALVYRAVLGKERKF